MTWRRLLFGAAALAIVLGTPARAEEASSGSDGSFASRLTLAIPFFSLHFPKDREFNDRNWGGVLFYAVDDQFSLAAGDFINSYRRNTAFAGVSLTPWALDLSGLQVRPGLLAGFDLNGGYRGHDPIAPLLGAGTISISGDYSDEARTNFLNRLGLLITVIPGFGGGRSNAVNLALTVRL
jgi:hypothetical protein